MGRPRIHPPKDPNRPKQLQKINKGTFSKTNQPRPPAPPRVRKSINGRPKGVKNKMTLVKQTLNELGYNPASMQVALATMLMDMATKAEDPKTMLQASRELIKVNSELMSYISAKAKHGDEDEEDYDIDMDEDEPVAQLPEPKTTRELTKLSNELDEDGVIVPKGHDALNQEPIPLTPSQLLEARKRMANR